MAIGARITSNNLSGQTANVTFYPTSGGTINLGSKTIPFNNLTSDPYGVYEIYVPTYDYTYELTVSQSVDGVESFVFMSKMISNNNNGVINMNFNDFTVVVLDLDIDYTGWYINDLYPLTNSGYGYYFQNNNGCNLWWVVFTDSAGNVIGEYQADTDCEYNYDVVAGKYVYFTDYTNGITKYSNGQEVFTVTVDPSYQYLDFETGWDGVTSTDNMVVTIYENTGNTYTNYILSGETLTQFGEPINQSSYYNYISTYFSGSFIRVFKYDQISNNYNDLKIYDSDGTLLQTLDLTGATYNNFYDAFYGDNKYVVAFWNNGDSNVDYLIVHYDGNTDTLTTMTHDRGANYQSINMNAQQRFYPSNGGCESFVIILYHQTTGNSIGSVVDYCDLIYMLSGDTNFRTHVFQNSGAADKTINTYFLVSNSLTTLCDNGNGIVSTLSLVPSGATYNSFNLPMSASPYYWISDIVGNGSFYVVTHNNNHDIVSAIHILENGVLGDLISGIPLRGAYNLTYNSIGRLVQLTNYTGLTYHIDDTSDLFQSGGTLSGDTLNIYYPNSQFKSDFLRTGPILTYNYVTRESNILSSTGYTDTFILPENTDAQIEVGSDKFMFTFIDMSGFTNINLYDFNYNLLNSVVTEYTSYWSTNSCGDRFVTIINENNQYICYLVSESTISSGSLTNDNSYYSFNDFIWWD